VKIKRVKLNNYTQHKDLDVSIDNDFVGIIGENGSGKSNFINSISDAITGEFHKKKARIISHGEKTGEIFLEGEFDEGESFSIKKPLGSGDVTLTIGDISVFGAEPVNSKILEKLDCDKSFLSNMVFVKQDDILGLLFGRPAERNKLLQKFFGLERAQRVDLAITSWMATIPETVEIDESLVKEEISQAKEAIKATTAEQEETLELLAEVSKRIKEDAQSIEKIESLNERARAYERAKSEIDKYTTEKESIKQQLDELTPPSTEQSELDELKSAYAEIKERVSSLVELDEFLREALEGGHTECEDGTCAVCGSTLDRDSKQKIEKRIEFLSREIEEGNIKKKEVYVKIEKISSEFDAYINSEKPLKKRLDYVQSQLDALTLSSGEKPPKRHSQEYKEAIDEFAELQSTAGGYKVSIEMFTRAIDGYKATLSRCNNSLVVAEKAKKENDAIRSHKKKVSRVQGLFKHNGSATELYVNTKMKRMCSSINEYLLGFSSPYKVRVNSDNEFVCQFPDKNILSGELSCGQKVILSLAFRFAACEVFTSKTNFIVLDEPTTWLDRKRIDSFGEVLNSVKNMSQRKHFQVLVVTHEKSLMPHFDQVIEL
jgi:DNA repair exonuclease SbcCD ATPase subunit